MKNFFGPNSIFCNFKNSQKSIFEPVKKFKTTKNAISQIFYLISRVFLAWNFLNFLARCEYKRLRIFGVMSLKMMRLRAKSVSYASKINLSLSNSSFSNSTHQKYMDKLIYSLIHLTQSIFVYFIYYIISVLGMYMRFDLLLTEMIRIFVRCIHKILQVIV